MEQIKNFSEASIRPKSLKVPISSEIGSIDDQLDYKSYGLDSTKTRLAEEYVIKKKLERSERTRRKKAILEREEEEKIRREEEQTYNNSLL
ncbi:MAG: hypothetical protein JST59_01355 [Actinobacteria bacterium]|nr:hypothetical protein [Actinomycetota bacterium]